MLYPFRVVAFLFLLSACATPPAPPPLPRHPAAESEAQAISRLMAVSSALEQSPFTRGNAATLLINGPQTYQAMLAAIGSARLRIDMESYQFDTDGARLFAPVLARKAREGVAVHLIYDAWGSLSEDRSLFDGLRQAGVQVVEYNPIGRSLDLDRRDHRKLLVVDGAVAIVGGVNVTGVYLNDVNRSATDPEAMRWRDTDVRLEGPVVGQFSALFERTWRAQGGPALPPPAAPGRMKGSATVQAIDGAPADGHPVIYETLLAAIGVARHSVHLTTGFFVPPPDLQRAMIAAARRGVDVAVIVPSRSDSHLAVAAGRAHYHDLLEAGVRLYELQGAVLHAKTATVDGLWSVVGSSNLDWRSTVLNNEIDAVIIDSAFASRMEETFEADSARSQRVTAAAWADRGIGERMNEWFARLLEEQL